MSIMHNYDLDMQPWEGGPHRRGLGVRPPRHFHPSRCGTPPRLRRSPPVRRPRLRRDRPLRYLPPGRDEGRGPRGPGGRVMGGPGYHPDETSLNFNPCIPPPTSRVSYPPGGAPQPPPPPPRTGQAPPLLMDLHEQVRVPFPTSSAAPPTLPCALPHALPTPCGSPLPPCSLVFSSQHFPSLLPSCSVHHVQVSYPGFHPVLPGEPFVLHPPPPHVIHPHPHPHSHPHPHHHPHPHLTSPARFLSLQQQTMRAPLQRIESEVELLTEHVVTGLAYGASGNGAGSALPPPNHPHVSYLPAESLNQELTFGMPYPHYVGRRGGVGGRRARSQQPFHHPAYHTSFLPYFLSVLPMSPTMAPPFGLDLDVDDGEALLTLAERLGEAKPRGLSKQDVDQLPSYRYNPENQQSEQSLCVVCMFDFEARQLLRLLPCSHEFHAKCVDKWLRTNRTCPICRADASEIHRDSE
uniref:RING finger protein 44-like isoform X2 n=1 Tax=Myxine glutinosa TaxID=7769 RepID=UPI00358DFCD9